MSSVPWLRQPLRLCDRMASNQQSVSASRFFPPEVCHAKYWPEPGVIVGTACATSKSSQKSLVGLRRGCWLLSPTTASAAPATKCRTQPAAGQFEHHAPQPVEVRAPSVPYHGITQPWLRITGKTGALAQQQQHWVLQVRGCWQLWPRTAFSVPPRRCRPRATKVSILGPGCA